MTNKERKAIEFIILINPLLYELQDVLDDEQERVIADIEAPAKRVAERLIEIDNRRIDLCNLKVLYGFIERGLGEKFGALRTCAACGADSSLYELALRQTELAGYDADRIEREFAYLFKLVRRKKPVAPSPALVGLRGGLGAGVTDCCAMYGGV